MKYKLAIALSEGGRPLEGIPLFKEIIAQPEYSNNIRAYSVQYMGHLLYSYNTPEVKNEVFKDEPYKSFYADGDYALARRKLFEYASSFKPLGVPELRVAKWYSAKILDRKGEPASPEKQKEVEEMVSVIKVKLANAEAYMKSVQADEFVSAYIPEVLYRKAGVLRDLDVAGVQGFENPETVYQEALKAARLKVGQESSTKIGYAIYLAQKYGEQRRGDIQNLLRDFYS